MAGWFYPQPPQPPTLTPVPPGAQAVGNAPPTPNGPLWQSRGQIAALWPQESWPAQTGDTIASQLAPTWANPPQPQPFYGTRPLDAVARSLWTPEDWQTQKLIGGGVGALVATVFVPPLSIATVNPAVLVALLQSWPQEAWSSQRAAQIASLLATVQNPPVIFPSRSRAIQSGVQSAWLPEDWYAQSECGIASGLAQIQLPPIYIPSPVTPRIALLRGAWPEESWPTQTLPPFAGWFPRLVTAVPQPVPHFEWQTWPIEQWPAQSFPKLAAGLAQAPAPQPYLNVWLRTLLRAAWPQEDWPAQTFPDIASGLAQIFTPVIPYSSVPQSPLSLWLPENWAAQRGALAPWLAPAAPPPKQYVLVWTAIYQLVNAGFVPYVTYATDPVIPAEYVISQSQPAGTVTGVPQVVVLVVSTGPAAPQGLTAVPNVIGRFAKDATDALQGAGLSLDRYKFAISSAPEGTVTVQSIAATTVVPPGTIIQLTLSAGPARVKPTLTVPLVH